MLGSQPCHSPLTLAQALNPDCESSGCPLSQILGPGGIVSLQGLVVVSQRSCVYQLEEHRTQTPIPSVTLCKLNLLIWVIYLAGLIPSSTCCYWALTCKWYLMVSVSFWLIALLSMIISRSIHVAANGIILLFVMAEYYSIVLYTIVYIFFIHSFVDGHLVWIPLVFFFVFLRWFLLGFYFKVVYFYPQTTFLPCDSLRRFMS